MITFLNVTQVYNKTSCIQSSVFDMKLLAVVALNSLALVLAKPRNYARRRRHFIETEVGEPMPFGAALGRPSITRKLWETIYRRNNNARRYGRNRYAEKEQTASKQVVPNNEYDEQKVDISLTLQSCYFLLKFVHQSRACGC